MLATAEKDLRLCNIVSDQVALLVSILLAIAIRFYLPAFANTSPPSLDSPAFIARYLALMALWYWCMRGTGNYDLSISSSRRIWSTLEGTLLFTVIVLAVAFLQWSLFSRAAVLLFVGLASAITLALRWVVPYSILTLLGRNVAIKILLIGEGSWATHLAQLLSRHYGYVVTHRPTLASPGSFETEGTEPAVLRSLLEEERPDEVILAVRGQALDETSELLNICNEYRVPWHFVPTIEQLVFANVKTHLFGGLPLIGLQSCSISGLDLAIKRIIDVAVAAVLTLLVSPILFVIWTAIKVSSPGPSIFVQKRVGFKGRVFSFYKFRTMYVSNDDKTHRDYVAKWISNQAYTQGKAEKTFKIVNDPRVTPLGRILRRYSLDELPQLFNVLKGDMSLVGPRPALLYEIDLYKEWHKERLEGLPGLTGLWQVAGRNQLSFDEMVKLDLEYLRNWSPAQDLKLILKTVPTVLLGTGR